MVSTRRAGREQVVDAQQCHRADARPIVPGGRPTGFLGSGETQSQKLEKSASGRAECGLRSAGDRFPARSMPKIEDSCHFVPGRRCCERAGALVIARSSCRRRSAACSARRRANSSVETRLFSGSPRKYGIRTKHSCGMFSLLLSGGWGVVPCVCRAGGDVAGSARRQGASSPQWDWDPRARRHG